MSDLAPITNRYRDALANDMGIDPDRIRHPGTLVMAESQRAGSEMVVAYRVGEITALRCAPELAAAMERFHNDGKAISLEALTAQTAELGWTVFDGGYSHLLTQDRLIDLPELPHELVSLDRNRAHDVALIGALVDACDDDDVEAAEIEIDDLDPHIVGLVNDAGSLLAYVSGREWEEDSGFDDIGVLIHPMHRQIGLGRGVVQTFCQQSFERSRWPLYRCNWSRPASRALALSVGFAEVSQLLALQPPEQS